MMVAGCVAAGTLTAGCMEADKGPESALPSQLASDGKGDTLRSPTERGPIGTRDVQLAELGAEEQFQSWTFTLTGNASMTLTTSTGMRNQAVDTVLYLYRQKADGTYGAYLARNDDSSTDEVFSQLSRDLTAGTYRVVVKGYSLEDTGRFALTTTCEGDGCAAAPCVFSSLAPVTGPYVASSSELGQGGDALSARDKARLLMATRQTALSQVIDGGDALAAIGGPVTQHNLYDSVGARGLTVLEFTAGGQATSVAFDFRQSEPIAVQKDGTVTVCQAEVGACALGTTWSDLRYNKGFQIVTETTVHSAAELSARRKEQALIAFQSADESVTSVAAGFARIDYNELRIVRMKKGAIDVEVFVYSAGDNTYGAVFRRATTDLLTHIIDHDFLSCNLFE